MAVPGLFVEEALAALRVCDVQSTRALEAALQAIEALEDMPLPERTCDRENDAIVHAVEALRAAVVAAYRSQFSAQRGLDFAKTMIPPPQ